MGSKMFLLLVAVGLSAISCASPTGPAIHTWGFVISGTQGVLVNESWKQHGDYYELTEQTQSGTLVNQAYLPSGLKKEIPVASGWTEELSASYADPAHASDPITVLFTEDGKVIASKTGIGSVTLVATM